MRSPFKTGERRGCYVITRPVTEDEIITMATKLTRKRYRRGSSFTDPAATRVFLQHNLAHLEHEVFSVIYLDNRHRLLAFEELFRGTINGASVYPREVVKCCLNHNAAAVILAHNHPSGVAEPSECDRTITRKIRDALALVEVRVLDHIVVGGTESVSFAERGWL